MTDTDSHDELDEILDALAEGDMSDSQADRLRALLEHDNVAVKRYVQWSEMESDLRCDYAGTPDVTLPENTPAAQEHIVSTLSRSMLQRASRHPMWPAIVIAPLVLVLIITPLAFIVAPGFRQAVDQDEHNNPQPRRIVAQLTGLHEAVWSEGQTGTRPGAYLMTGHRMELKEGRAEIAFRSGATVILQGPTTFIPHEEGRGRLLLGQLTAKVPLRAVGFTVETPQATVVDLGTEFGVSVENDRIASAIVFDGSVLVIQQSANGSADRQRVLVAGQAVRLEPGRMVDVKPGTKRFAYARSLTPVTDGQGNYVLRPTTSATANNRGKVVWNGPLNTGQDGAGAVYCGLLRFDLAAHRISPDDVRSAKLRLWLTKSQQYGDVSLAVAAERWNQPADLPRMDIQTMPETFANFANSRQLDSEWIPPAIGQYYEVDVTPAVNQWLRDPQSNFGFVLRGPKSPMTGQYFTGTYREFSRAPAGKPVLLLIEMVDEGKDLAAEP